MAKHPSPFQRNLLLATLKALICFSLLTICAPRAAFANIDLSTTSLDPVTTGFILRGNAASDSLGGAVSTAGDIDNDGYDDIIVGAQGINGNRGAVYVIYGGEKSSISNIDLSSITLDPQTTGFMITGNAAGDYFGSKLNRAGDVNNDGYDDIIVGAFAKNSGEGVAYVIYGGARSSMANIYLSTQTLDPLTTGFMIIGEVGSGSFGRTVSTAGDLNNDGYDDIIIGADSINSFQGAAYVIYGGEKSSMTNIVLSTTILDPASTGFKISGNAANDHFGREVSTAGDINNDGYDDIIIGADGVNSNQGAAYVIYGGEKSSMSNIILSTQVLDPLTTGFKVTGNAAGDYFGIFVNIAGDIDNDGYGDIIIGAVGRNSYQGAAYVIYGGLKSSMSNIALSTQTLDPASRGFMITGNAVGDNFGNWVNTAGDVNNDGFHDIIVGAYAKNSNQGAAYVIYGGEKSSMTNIALSTTTLDPLTTGFKITGNAGDYLCVSVSTAGDFNKDGFNDLIVGAYGKGVAYLISPAQCTTYCNECSSFTGCIECKNPYLLYQFECLASCPNTTFTESDTCKDYSTHCNLCNSASLCTECLSPYVLYKSYCVASCPKTMFNSNNICKDCPSHCLTCLSQDSCQVCFKGYTLSNSLCVLSSQGTQETATQSLASATRGIGSVVSVGSSIFPFTALVSKIVQNTRYLNLSVTSELLDIYQTWDTNLISWDVPNVMSNLDHFEESPDLFARYEVDSPFLVNFWPTLVNIVIGFGTFMACIVVRKIFEHENYEGWAYSLVLKLIAGSFNFALVQAYACLGDILFYLVLDAKTNPFNSFFSWMSIICAVGFLVVGCLLVFFNFWTVKKYQDVKEQGDKNLIEVFNERNKIWELFYSDFNDDDLWSQSFFAILLIRSTLSSLISTVFYDYPLMQISYLLILDAGIILFLYFKTPFNTLRGKFAQYYYEIITLLVHLCTFILSYQDSSENPSDTVRSILSTGIIYLNTALITGAIGFMFLEIYKTISEKTRAARNKQSQSLPENTQETQNLTQKVSPFQPSEAVAQKGQYWINSELAASIETVHMESENSQIHNQSSQAPFEAENSVLSDMDPSYRIIQQRNQNQMPIMIRLQRQEKKPKARKK